MENVFNQTRPESLNAAKAALASGQEELGTGVFVVPASRDRNTQDKGCCRREYTVSRGERSREKLPRV